MIASVRGGVAAITSEGAVVEVGGVGLAVHCTAATLAGLRIGADVRLATSLVVREDSLTLYGFGDDDERSMFELLQTATGVGPRLALAVLSVHSPDVVRKALANSDIATLTQVPGIGKKGAERLVLELRDKVGPVTLASSTDPVRPAARWRTQVAEALIGLGWSASQADQAVGAVAAALGPEPVPPVSALLKQAIQVLGSAR